MALAMTLGSKVPSTVSLLVPPMGRTTKELWSLDCNLRVTCPLEPK